MRRSMDYVGVNLLIVLLYCFADKRVAALLRTVQCLHHVTVSLTVSLSRYVTDVVGIYAADFDLVQQWHEAASLGQDVGYCRL